MKTKLYYHFEIDVMVIIEGKNIYKYIGNLSKMFPVFDMCYETNKWYKAKVPVSEYTGFVLIGEW